MRKLKLEMQISMDGFTAGPDGDSGWMIWPWSEEWSWDDRLRSYHNDLTTSSDCILISRKMAEEGFCGHWEEMAMNIANPQAAFATKITETRKLVVTRTLSSSTWKNAELLKGDAVLEVSRLKKAPGKDILVYGGPTLASSLVEAGLIDELYLLVNPTAIGRGSSMFKDLSKPARFRLENSTSYKCGIALLKYVVDAKPTS